MRFTQFLILSLFMTAAAAAKEPENVEVVVKGNKVLSDKAISKISGVEQSPDISPQEVKERLRSTSLFSRVRAVRDQDVLTISVKEKTSWFVLPYFSSDANAKVFGGAAGKSGLRGDHGNLVGRYQVGAGGQEGSVLLRDEYFFDSLWIAGLSLDFENSQRRVFNQTREVQHRTANHYKGGSLQTGYHVSAYFILGLNTYIEQHRFEELNGQYFEGLQVSHRLLANLSNLSVDEGLTDGVAVQVYFETPTPLSDFQFRKYGILGQIGVLRAGNLNWISRPRFEGGATLSRYQLFELGGAKLRSFPSQNFRGKIYFSSQNDLLLTSIDIWKLKFRPLVYADWVFIENAGRTGLGTGFQVFFQDVTVPALQFFSGYGFHPNGFSASAAIGPQF